MNAINETPKACRPFKIAVPEDTLADIRRRVENFPWHEMPRGGHFAAVEQPELLVDDIRCFARSLQGR